MFGTIIKFSESAAAEGALHAKRKHHFPIDKATLKTRADLALKKQHEFPLLSFQDIMKEVLSDIDFNERKAYACGISKMFRGRVLHHHKVSA